MNRNKINNITIALIVLVLISSLVNALQTNGSNLNNDFVITSGSSSDLSSTNFKSSITIGDISDKVSSSNFINELGFIRTAHYLDGEACEVNRQCSGAFCCSSVCQSTSCPVAEEEVEGAKAAAAAGTGGGGGGFATTSKDFALNVDLIRANVKQGGTFRTQLIITNIGRDDLSFNLEADLADLLLLGETEFLLSAGDSKTIDIIIFAAEEKRPDIYTGKVKISAGTVVKSVLVVIEVQAKKPLFDISVKVLPQYKDVLKGESVAANITLINVGDLKPVDVELFYALRDIEGNDIVFGFETLAVHDKVFRLKELELPANVSFGPHLFYAKLVYGIETAASGDLFNVVEVKPESCYDGIKNQNERRVDCGGVCGACARQDLGLIIDFIIDYNIWIVALLILAVFYITKFQILKPGGDTLIEFLENLKVKRTVNRLERLRLEQKKLESELVKEKRSLLARERAWKRKKKNDGEGTIRYQERLLVNKCFKITRACYHAIEKGQLMKAKVLYQGLLDSYLRLSNSAKNEVYNEISSLYEVLSKIKR